MVYSAGGCGINIISKLEAMRDKPDVGIASIFPYYIDTSRSNLITKNLPIEYVHLFEGMDGGGKKRATNAQEITQSIPAILQKFKPGDYNIVVHAASGASGSVLAPNIVSELKARGHMVIAIIIGSTDTHIEMENTVKTLKSYEGIAANRKSSVVCHYLENSPEFPQDKVDQEVIQALTLLCGLFSGQHERLDSQDLKNWLEYITISGAPGQLASLSFCTTPEEMDAAGNIVSVATLSAPGMTSRLDRVVQYQATGIVPTEWLKGSPGSIQMIDDSPIHYAISTDGITKDIKRLTKQLAEVNALFASRNTRASFLDESDKPTSNGMVY